MKRLIIAVDFDGTIVPDSFPGKPSRFMPGAAEALTALHQAGHVLVLWSLRDSGSNGIAGDTTIGAAMDFLRHNGLGFIRLPREVFGAFPHQLPKLPFDLFIEDKIPGGFQGWEFVRKTILEK